MGAVVLIWQRGYGSELIWDIEATGSLPSWLPLIAFAFLFGLSMDYEVFLLDATVIRALIVPATIAAMGRWNWWLPSWAARLLRVQPSLPARSAGIDSRR